MSLTEPAIALARLSKRPEFAAQGRALLEAYLRMPDAWAGGEVPARLPAAYFEYVAGYPGHAAPPTGEAFLAVVGGQASGQALVVPHADGVARIERTYVAPETRGRGVGTALLAAAITWAREQGLRRIVLDVLPTRERAISLYRAAGFVPSQDYDADGRLCMSLDLALAD